MNTKRNNLVNKFMELNLGDLGDDLWEMPIDDLEAMVDELTTLQAEGYLDLETSDGVDYLKSTVDKYL